MHDEEPTRKTRYTVWPPLLEIVRARFFEFIRRPEAVFWVYVFPLLMVLALGIAFRNKPVETIEVALVRVAGGEELATALKHDERIRLRTGDLASCEKLLRTGKVALVVIPTPPTESGSRAEPPKIVYRYDPTRPGSLVAKETVDHLLQRWAGRTDPLPTTDEMWDEPGGRYIDFLIPGMLGMGLMGGGLWGVGFAIVDMRIRRLLKRLMATPMRRTDFLMGVMLSRLLFVIPEMAMIVLFARVVFGVVVYGSYGAVALLILLGAFEFSGIGLLVASRARTLESVSGLMNLTMLPMWVLSGIFFSYERFPEAVQPLIRLLPLTPLIDALRKVMQEGEPLAGVVPEMGVMSVWMIVTFVVALRIFRWSD